MHSRFGFCLKHCMYVNLFFISCLFCTAYAQEIIIFLIFLYGIRYKKSLYYKHAIERQFNEIAASKNWGGWVGGFPYFLIGIILYCYYRSGGGLCFVHLLRVFSTACSPISRLQKRRYTTIAKDLYHYGLWGLGLLI